MPELTAAADRRLAWIEAKRDEFSLRWGRDAWEQTMLLEPSSELVLTVALLSRNAALRDKLAPVIE